MSVDQACFRRALMSADAPRPEGLSDGQGRAAGRRFDVYRNNVASSLTDALEVSFPALRKIIGPNNFRAVMGVFLRQHPPSVPMISQYGAALPGFLEGFPPLAHLGYLPDVARLEQALRESYHAADGTPIDPAILQDLTPEALARSRLRLAPSLRLVRSPWPVHAIWAFNMEGGPKPAPEAQDVIVTRPGFDPAMALTARGGGAFVACLLHGATMGDALDAGAADAPDFDLAALLGLLIGQEAIHQIIPGDAQ